MYIPFEQLSPQAPIWIYQADGQLSDEQVDKVCQKINIFLANWTSHGRPLQAGAIMQHSRFLILGIEKPSHELSCCTLDNIIYLLREVKADLQINFLNRSQLFFKKGDDIFGIPLNQVKEKMHEGMLDADTFLFDNALTCKADLANKWLIPIKHSWLHN